MAMLQKGRQPLVMLLLMLMPMEGTGLKVMLMLTQKLRRRRKPKMMLLTRRTKKIYLQVAFMEFNQLFLNTVIVPQLTVLSGLCMNLNGEKQFVCRLCA